MNSYNSGNGTVLGSDCWVNSTIKVSAAGTKRTRVEEDGDDEGEGERRRLQISNEDSASAPPTSTITSTKKENNSSTPNHHKTVSVKMKPADTHWLESLYIRAAQNSVASLAIQQERHEQLCIDRRTAFEAEARNDSQVFQKKLQALCVAKRRALSRVSNPASATSAKITGNNTNSSTTTGGDIGGGGGVGLDFLSQFSDDAVTDTPQFGENTIHSQNMNESTVNDGGEEEENFGDFSYNHHNASSKAITLATRTLEIDAAVDAFREKRLADFRSDEEKHMADNEQELTDKYPLGNLEVAEQAELLLELGATWRQKLAEITNPDSALRKRMASDPSYVRSLVKGTRNEEDDYQGTDDSDSLLYHLTHASDSASVFLSANPDSTLLNLISVVTQKRLQSKLDQQEASAEEDTARRLEEDEAPLAKLGDANPRRHDAGATSSSATAARSTPPSRMTIGASYGDVLIDAMAQVARHQSRITAKEELPTTSSTRPYTHLPQHEGIRHFLSKCSGASPSPSTAAAPGIVSSAVATTKTNGVTWMARDGLTGETDSTTIGEAAKDTTCGENGVSTTTTTLSVAHLGRVSAQQLRLETAARLDAQSTGTRANIPVDYPYEFTIPLGGTTDGDDEDARDAELVEKYFNWPHKLLGKRHHIPNTTTIKHELSTKTNSAAVSGATSQQACINEEIQGATLLGMATLSGGTIGRNNDEIYVTGGSILTVPKYHLGSSSRKIVNNSNQSINNTAAIPSSTPSPSATHTYLVGGEAAVSSYVLSAPSLGGVPVKDFNF